MALLLLALSHILRRELRISKGVADSGLWELPRSEPLRHVHVRLTWSFERTFLR